MTRDRAIAKLLKEKARGIGGSDAAAVFDADPYKSKLQLYLEKVGDLGPNDSQSEPAFWGTVLEAPVARVFAKRRKYKLKRVGVILHKDHPFLLTHLDREIVDDARGPGVLEVKTANENAVRGWGDHELPVKYYLQGQHSLMVTGYTWGEFALLVGGQKLEIYQFERDEELIQNMLAAEVSFWVDHVLAKVPPSIEDALAYKELLNRLYPESTGSSIELPTELARNLVKLAKINRLSGLLAKAKALNENAIKEVLKENSTGTVDGRALVSWQQQKGKEVLDLERLQGEAPDVYRRLMRRFSREKDGTRVFRPAYSRITEMFSLDKKTKEVSDE